MECIVKILPRVEDDLAKISAPAQSAIRAAIKALAAQPRPVGIVKMSGYSDVYRIRVGKYRIVYVIHDGEFLVIVVAVAPRKSIYPIAKRRIGSTPP